MFQITAAYDNDPKCVATYNRNLEPVARLADLENWREMDIPECHGIIASPPCQDASIANQRIDRGRSSLYVTTARIIAAKHPQWAVIENVPGMLNRSEFGEACQLLTEAGYWLTTHKMRHDLYGGYTTRERVFLVAARTMLPVPGQTPNTEGHKALIDRFLPELRIDNIEWSIMDRVNQVIGDATFDSTNFGKTRPHRYLHQPYFTLTKENNPVTRLDDVWYRWNNDICSVAQGLPVDWQLSRHQIGNAIPPELTRPWGQILRRAYGPDQSVVSLFCGAGGGDYGLMDGAS